jgi:hypothetical protein
MAALLLLSGNWFTGICHAALLAYMVQLYTTKRIFVDTTDAFRQLPQQKVQRGIMLGAHLVLFVVVVYRSAQGVASFCWSGPGCARLLAQTDLLDVEVLACSRCPGQSILHERSLAKGARRA